MILNIWSSSPASLTHISSNQTYTIYQNGVTIGSFHLTLALLRFTSSSSPTFIESYYLNNTTISLVDHHKDLGGIFSSNLSWDNHYNHISRRAYKILGLLRRTFSSTSFTETKESLYLTLVSSQLTYASPIWCPHKIKHITMLEKIQSRATKFILNNYSADYKTRLLTLHLLSLMMTLEINNIMFFINNLVTPMTPITLKTTFTSTT